MVRARQEAAGPEGLPHAGGTQDRRAGHPAGLPGWKTPPGRHPGQRGGRGGRHPQRPDRPEPATGALHTAGREPAGDPGGPGRGLHAPERLPGSQPRPGGAGGAALRQPPQRRRRRRPAARPGAGSPAGTPGLGVWSVRIHRTGQQQPPDVPPGPAGTAAAGQPPEPALLGPRGGAGLLPGDPGTTGPAGLRDRRHCRQGGPHQSQGNTWGPPTGNPGGPPPGSSPPAGPSPNSGR